MYVSISCICLLGACPLLNGLHQARANAMSAVRRLDDEYIDDDARLAQLAHEVLGGRRRRVLKYSDGEADDLVIALGNQDESVFRDFV